MKKVSTIIILITLIVLITSCTLIKTEYNPKIAYYNSSHSIYGDFLVDTYGKENTKENYKSEFYTLEDGFATETYGIKFISPEFEKKYTYTPHYLTTIVIGIDKRLSNIEINSWEDLFAYEGAVGWDTNKSGRFALASISYGLTGEYTSNLVVKRLREKYINGLLNVNNLDENVIIDFDHNIVSMNKSGKNYRIVIPKEGTLSFDKGIVYETGNGEIADLIDSKENEYIENKLLTSGLRTLDGKTLYDGYPEPENYLRSHHVKDDEKFLTETFRYIKTLR